MTKVTAKATKASKGAKSATSIKAAKKTAVEPLSSYRLKRLDIIVIVLTICLVGFGLWRTNANKLADTGQCQAGGTEHQVALNNDRFTPATLDVVRCDRIVVSNTGDEPYDLAFGTHDDHQDYPGFTRQPLKQGEYLVIDAVQAGSYDFHDHIRDAAKLQLTVQ